MAARAEHLALGVEGMDCAECALHIEQAVARLPGVQRARVLLAAERLEVEFDPAVLVPGQVQAAVEGAGYRVAARPSPPARDLGARLSWLFVAAVAAVVLIELVAERLGWIDRALGLLPPWIAVAAVLAGGYPIFLKVLRALRRRQVTAHALMSLGVVAALALGEVVAAALIVFFMRLADFLDGYTTERSRHAIRSLMRLAPETARRLTSEGEEIVPADTLRPGDALRIRPGERIPADGMVTAGAAALDQSAITGESLPQEAGPGRAVFAGSIVHGGSLQVRVTRAGPDTTLGRIVRLVEQAEGHKAPVQRLADRFTAVYIPVVAGAAALTYLIGGSPTAAIAVLLVACACAVALATPTAVIASVGRAAREGILIKGGRYLELLARADTLVMDKTGTLTLGRPQVTAVLPADGVQPAALLSLAAMAERHSEHPLAEAVRAAARHAGAPIDEPETFEALSGLGVRARRDGHDVLVGAARLLHAHGLTPDPRLEQDAPPGSTLFYVAQDGHVLGALAVADRLRPEAAAALDQLRGLGFRRMLILTGDTEAGARAIAAPLGLEMRAGLLPEDKIAAVRALQADGAVVLMVGDGVNDAPALAQADVGVAMGVAGSDVALQAAPVALMRDDWLAVPRAVEIGRRAFRAIQQNLAVAVLYNLTGISLAAVGLLPPVAAAAAQSLPDLLVMLNSSRLLRAPRTGLRRGAAPPPPASPASAA